METKMSHLIEDCNTCYVASLTSKKKFPFQLCDQCSEVIASAKRESKQVQSVEKGPYRFQICRQGDVYKIDVAQAGSTNHFVELARNLNSVQECLDAIQVWMNRPFKMSGGLINLC
jgi:hypothetical protein